MRLPSLLLLTSLCLTVSNCSLRSMAVQQMGELIVSGVPAFEKDDDLELVKQALPANIKLLEVMLESDPENLKILTLLSQMYASYTFAFIESDLEAPGVGDKALLKERVNRLYMRGIQYGERALGRYQKRCEEGLKVIAALDDCLASLDKAAVPALYWYSFNIAAYLNRNMNSMAALAQGPKMEKALNRVVALDEGYNFGTAHLFLMLYYGARSPMMGGNHDKAESHYQAIRKLAGDDFLLADVFRARYLLVQQQAREDFEKQLKAVLASSPNPDKAPQMRLYNSLAKARAKLYLSSVDDFF